MGNLVVVRKNLRSLHSFSRKKHFEKSKGSDTFKIREGLHLHYNLENVICLITCKKCKKQYYRSYDSKFCKTIPSLMFHLMLFLFQMNTVVLTMSVYILIDNKCNKQETRKKQLFWQQKLDIFVLHGLNEQEVDLESI